MTGSSRVTFAALLLSVAVIMAGNGLQGGLLLVRASLEDFSPAGIALVSSGYFMGFIAGCLTAPALIRKLGPVGSVAVFATAAAAAAFGHELIVEPLAWGGLRLVTGFCFSGFYMVVESWINAAVGNATRGRTLALYRAVDLGATTLGQFLLPLADARGPILFALVATLILLSQVPIALAPRPDRAAEVEAARLDLRRLYRTSPLALWGAAAMGMSSAGFWSLAPVFVERDGHGSAGVALFIACGILGGAAFQWPLGWLSDRRDRRWVMIGAALLAGASAAASALAPADDLSLRAGLAGLFGGFSFPIYALAAAHANDRAGPGEFVAVSGGLLLVFAVGGTVGPILAALAVDGMGRVGLFGFSAVVYGLLALHAGRRMTVRPTDR